MIRTRSVGVPAAFLLLAAACSDSLAPSSSRALVLSFSTAASATGASTSRSPRADVVVGAGTADSLRIDSAQVVLREIELRDADSSCVPGSMAADDDGDGCEALKLGPMLVSLPLGDGVGASVAASIPAGTYRAIEFELHRVRDDSRDAAFTTAHPELAGASVRVTGTYRGQRFVYTSSVNAEQELEFTPPVVVDGMGASVTVRVDVASWFKDANGATIAPTADNAGRIEERIRASFRAFEDDDRDGDEG
jgi:hypothetical protein